MIKIQDNKLLYEPNRFVDIVVFRNKDNIKLSKFFDNFDKNLIGKTEYIIKLVYTEDELYQKKFNYIVEYCCLDKLNSSFALDIIYCHMSDVSSVFYFSSKKDLTKILLNLPM